MVSDLGKFNNVDGNFEKILQPLNVLFNKIMFNSKVKLDKYVKSNVHVTSNRLAPLSSTFPPAWLTYPA